MIICDFTSYPHIILSHSHSCRNHRMITLFIWCPRIYQLSIEEGEEEEEGHPSISFSNISWKMFFFVPLDSSAMYNTLWSSRFESLLHTDLLLAAIRGCCKFQELRGEEKKSRASVHSVSPREKKRTFPICVRTHAARVWSSVRECVRAGTHGLGPACSSFYTLAWWER